LYEFNTLKLSKLIHPSTRGYALDVVYKRFRVNFDNVCKKYSDVLKKFGVENPQRHRALPDALVTAEVFRKMLTKLAGDHDIATFARFKSFYSQE
jgi:DNA polymerase III epsilon subunit-like protein